MERRGLGIPRRGLCLQTLAQTRFPFLPGPHFYSLLSLAGAPARARLGARHIVLNVRAALLWPSAPPPHPPASRTAFPSLAGSGPGFGGFPLPLSISLGFVFLPGGDWSPPRGPVLIGGIKVEVSLGV